MSAKVRLHHSNPNHYVFLNLNQVLLWPEPSQLFQNVNHMTLCFLQATRLTSNIYLTRKMTFNKSCGLPLKCNANNLILASGFHRAANEKVRMEKSVFLTAVKFALGTQRACLCLGKGRGLVWNNHLGDG